jgi:hypothetical protein
MRGNPRSPLWLTLAGVLALVAPAGAAPLPPIGVSYSGWSGGFADAATRLQAFRAVGFPLVTLVPAYAYVGRNKIDVSSGPSVAELAGAIEAARRIGLQVVLKPHLEPLAIKPGYRRAQSDNHSWRAECGWRGFFDLDPLTPQYRDGVIFAALRALKEALGKTATLVPADGPPVPVRLDLGAELMNSIVEHPERWRGLLRETQRERKRLGLEGQVLLSHNFSHHLEIAEDVVDRLSPGGRRALGRYIAGLDALAISQYMDLTAAVPVAERASRLPTADEVAESLRIHERDLRRNILQAALGIRPAAIPPFHIGEFGVGTGGLKHPNLWSGPTTAEEERDLSRQIARAHEGLVRYLGEDRGRTARSAVLWVTGPHYDIFGWRNPAHAIPEAAAAIRAGLARR